MPTILFSLCLFSLAFFLHWLLWRFWIPQRQILGLLWLFHGILGVVLVLGALSPGLPFWPETFWNWLHVLLFYEGASLAYMVVYSGLEQDSPSMRLVMFVADAGGLGRSSDDLCGLFHHDASVANRLDSLVQSKLIVSVAEGYRLTRKGAFWATLFRCYRVLFRLELGG